MPGTQEGLYSDVSDPRHSRRAGALDKACQQRWTALGKGHGDRDSQEEETLWTKVSLVRPSGTQGTVWEWVTRSSTDVIYIITCCCCCRASLLLAPEMGTRPIDFLITSSPPSYFGEWGTILALPFSVLNQTPSPGNCAAISLQFLPSGSHHPSWGSSALLEPVKTLSWPYSSLFLMHPAHNCPTNCSKIQMFNNHLLPVYLRWGLHISLWSGCCLSFLDSSHLQIHQWLLCW